MNRSRHLMTATMLALSITSVHVSGLVLAADLDPVVTESMERVIEQYLRTHPEVIEQSLQALEARREAEERPSKSRACGTSTGTRR